MHRFSHGVEFRENKQFSDRNWRFVVIEECDSLYQSEKKFVSFEEEKKNDQIENKT